MNLYLTVKSSAILFTIIGVWLVGLVQPITDRTVTVTPSFGDGDQTCTLIHSHNFTQIKCHISSVQKMAFGFNLIINKRWHTQL